MLRSGARLILTARQVIILRLRVTWLGVTRLHVARLHIIIDVLSVARRQHVVIPRAVAAGLAGVVGPAVSGGRLPGVGRGQLSRRRDSRWQHVRLLPAVGG